MKSTENNSSTQVLKKTQPEEFHLVILGGGTGSAIAAWTFARQGRRVAVIDRKYLGGSCPKKFCQENSALQSKTNLIFSGFTADFLTIWRNSTNDPFARANH